MSWLKPILPGASTRRSSSQRRFCSLPRCRWVCAHTDLAANLRCRSSTRCLSATQPPPRPGTHTLQWCRCGRCRGRNLAESVAVRRRFRAKVGVFWQSHSISGNTEARPTTSLKYVCVGPSTAKGSQPRQHGRNSASNARPSRCATAKGRPLFRSSPSSICIARERTHAEARRQHPAVESVNNRAIGDGSVGSLPRSDVSRLPCIVDTGRQPCTKQSACLCDVHA